jgi:homoserine kinase type II
MAVYTKLTKENIEEILSNYSIGNLKEFKGIEEGIENTNYFLLVDNKKYILTIYEKRVKEKDLPFFSQLMSNLNKSGFRCPVPIESNDKKTIVNYKNKNLMIVSFLEGKAKKILSPEDCKSVGREVAKMHEITKNFNIKRDNNLSVNSWRNIFDQVKDKCVHIHKDLPLLIESNLKDVEKNWPKDLPTGIIHADLFSDNIFFDNNNFSGIIDFYFSCNDFYALEIAICFNALCFDGPKNNLSFNVTKAISFMNGYNQFRKINNDEKKYIKVLSQGSALRFLLTRVFDSLNTVEGAIVKVKDPMEYLVRLEFHKNSKNYEDYFFS